MRHYPFKGLFNSFKKWLLTPQGHEWLPGVAYPGNIDSVQYDTLGRAWLTSVCDTREILWIIWSHDSPVGYDTLAFKRNAGPTCSYFYYAYSHHYCSSALVPQLPKHYWTMALALGGSYSTLRMRIHPCSASSNHYFAHASCVCALKHYTAHAPWLCSLKTHYCACALTLQAQITILRMRPALACAVVRPVSRLVPSRWHSSDTDT